MEQPDNPIATERLTAKQRFARFAERVLQQLNIEPPTDDENEYEMAHLHATLNATTEHLIVLQEVAHGIAISHLQQRNDYFIPNIPKLTIGTIAVWDFNYSGAVDELLSQRWYAEDMSAARLRELIDEAWLLLGTLGYIR